MYKIKHIPTGLFYQPSRGNGNLTKSGKIYKRRPTDKEVESYTNQVRVVMWGINKKPNKSQQLIIDHFNISLEGNSTYRSVDKYYNTKLSDWEVVDLFNEKTNDLHELTYDKVIEKLPKHVTELIGKDELITKSFELLKKNPYVAFAYLLGIVHSTRELYDGEQEIVSMLQQYGVIEIQDDKWKKVVQKQIEEEEKKLKNFL